MTTAPFTPEALALATGGQLLDAGPPGQSYTLSIDTRRIAPGQIYVALKGERFDGADFFPQILETPGVGVMGEAAAVRALPEAAWGGRPRIAVSDGVLALGRAGSSVRERFPDIPVVGLTGSAGKTTTRTLIQAALSPRYAPVHGTLGNLNNHFGVPLTLLNLGPHHRAAVIEMGMSGPGEIRALSGIARPTVRLITNVGRAHLDVLKDEDGVARAKGELFAASLPGDVLVVNHDDHRIATLPRPAGVRIVTFGRDHRSHLRLMDEGVRLGEPFTVVVEGEEIQISLALPGAHNRMNATAALAVAQVLGVPLHAAAAAMAQVRPEGMRMAVTALPSGARLLNDAYNANPDSMAAGLSTAAELAGDPARVLALLGEMLELGPLTEDSHRRVGAVAARLGIGGLMAVGPSAAATVAGALEGGMGADKARAFPDMDALIAALPRTLSADQVVLVKGSRGARMERAAQAIAKGEECAC